MDEKDLINENEEGEVKEPESVNAAEESSVDSAPEAQTAETPDEPSDAPESDAAEESDASENDAAESDDDSLEEKDGVKYETNDNWQFDAAAPTLDDDIIVENESFKITIDKPKKEEAPVKQKAAPKAENSDSIVISKEPLKFIPLAFFVAAVIAALVVLGIRYYTVPNGKEGELMNPASVVAEIDGQKISIGMYDYYYASIVSYYEQYAAYGYFDLDTTQDYSEQYTTDDDGEKISWQKFFETEALEEVEQITAYYNAALEDGVTLTDSQAETIETQMASLESSASENEVSLDEYIKANFGSYCSEETIRLMLEQYYMSANYKGKFKAETKISNDEIDEYYNDNKDTYKQIEFCYLAVEYDTSDDEAKEDSIKEAESLMKKMTSKDAVLDLVPDIYSSYISSEAESAMSEDDSLTEEQAIEEATQTYKDNVSVTVTGSDSPFDDEMNEWLFSDDTEVGSTKYYIDSDSGYIYVVLKTEKAELNDDETYTVRHILISPESEDSDSEDSDDSTETEYTDEEWAAAKKKANKVLKKFETGDKSEYSFAELAEEYSTDSGSTSSGSSDYYGGLYETVTLGEMVDEFEEWATDDSRKYGDTGIVKSSYGYHIMYFISDCPQYESEITAQLLSDKLDAIVENAKKKVHQSAIQRAVDKEAEAAEEEATSTTSSSSTTAAATTSADTAD